MNIATDLIIFLIVVFCTFLGYRKGFIRSFFNFFGGLISFALSSLFARPIASWTSNTFFQPILHKYLTKSFTDYLSEQVQTMTTGDITSSGVLFFRRFGFSQTELEACFSGAEDNMEELIYSAVDTLVMPIARSVAHALAMLLLFILFFLLIKFIERFFDLISKLPFLNFSNRSLGLVFGFCFGLLLALVFSCGLVIFEPMMQNSDLDFVSEFSVDKTVIARLLTRFLKI